MIFGITSTKKQSSYFQKYSPWVLFLGYLFVYPYIVLDDITWMLSTLSFNWKKECYHSIQYYWIVSWLPHAGIEIIFGISYILSAL